MTHHPASTGTRFHFHCSSSWVDPSTKVLPRPANTQREIAYLSGRNYVPRPTVPGEKRTRAEARLRFSWLR